MKNVLLFVVVGVYVSYVATAAVVLVKDAKRRREEEKKLTEGINSVIENLKQQVMRHPENFQKMGMA